MSTTIKTSSENQFDQIRRFVKKNNIYNTVTKENGSYTIKLFGLKPKELEKFIKNFIQTNHLTKAKSGIHQVVV